MLTPADKRYINSLDLPEEARTGKGIFPYSFITSQAVLEEERDALPSREVAFYDMLADSVTVTEADFDRAQAIWRLAECRNLKDYMLMYLKVDVYLLADVFETFRKTAMQEDALDPANFFGIPGLSWCSALKSMNRELELLQDLSMYDYFDAGVRGGMTFVNRHYACRNASTELLYIDINNLYGWALSQYLPARGFRWITEDAELTEIMSRPLPDENSAVGYVLEVDISVPVEHHDRLSDLPPAPLSQIPPGSKVKKLLLDLEPKTHYIIHSALLKFYVEEMGVRVDKVHRAIGFTQEKVFAKYIAMNTEKRAKSTTKFQKDYYKLKNNALYGKTVENLRKRKDVRLCTNRKSFVAQSSKPCFRRSIIIKENLVAAILNKETIVLDRPVYIGQAVLDLSKLRMYRLQYIELQRYREQFAGCMIRIVAGDTDSFFLEVKGVSLANQLLPQMQQDGLLDTSNYPTDSVLFSRHHENKIGLFKDESGGIDVYKEWVFLRPKCYSMLCEDDSSCHKAKGVKRGTDLAHQQYVDIFQSFHPDADAPPSPKRLRVDQRRIGSINHDIFTTHYSKLALSINDDKRAWIAPNTSLPYGHYRLHD
jgi:DNA polymerase type B, organellar and viral